MGPRHGLITQTGDRVQQDRRAYRTPLLLGPRFAKAFQQALLVLAEDQQPTPPLKGHAPLKHRWGLMSSYLENTHLEVSHSAHLFCFMNVSFEKRIACPGPTVHLT